MAVETSIIQDLHLSGEEQSVINQPVESWSSKRSSLREKVRVSSQFRKSLQNCLPVHCKVRLIHYELSSCKHAKVKQNRLNGLISVLDELMAVTENGKSCGCITFEHAFELYSSHFAYNTDEQYFRDLMCDQIYGIPVYIYTNSVTLARFVILQNSEVDMEHIVETIASMNHKMYKREDRLCLNHDSVDMILNTVDTEYDCKVAKSLLAANRSRQEIYDMGMKPDRVISALHHVRDVAIEVGNAEKAASDMVNLRLKERSELLQKHVEGLNKVISFKAQGLKEKWVEDLEEKRDSLLVRLEETQRLMDPKQKSDKESCRRAIKRTANRLIDENRLKKRKLGAGQPKLLDSDDEEFIAKAIESKSTAHGRRHDMVLYTSHRVKKQDLLSLAYYNRVNRGKKLIKSATSAYNRAQPRNKRSLQTKKHLGKGLFCFKKPPKTEAKDNLLTHHQRKRVKLAKEHIWGDNDVTKYSLEISMDDKAYLRPGTSVGMSGTKQPKIMQTSLESDLPGRQLPIHDFSEPKLHITPSAFRFMTRVNEEVENVTVPVLDEDKTCFVARPKHYVGSSGSVWASDIVKLRCEKPDLFEVPLQEEHSLPLAVKTFCSVISLNVKYYMDTTEEDDVTCVTQSKDCEFRQYELKRALYLQDHINNATTEWQINKVRLNQAIEERMNSIHEGLHELNDALNTVVRTLNSGKHGDALREAVFSLKIMCEDVQGRIDQIRLPPVRPRILFLTDAGPGVGVSNNEVQFRSCEIVRLFNLDWEFRVHRATDDPCEAERSNAAAGDAIVDGGALPVPSVDPFAGLSSEMVESLNESEVTKLQEEAMENTVWKLAEEVQMRIDSAPGPHGLMSAFVTDKANHTFFWNREYLNRYVSAPLSKKSSVPGHSYFEKLDSFRRNHYSKGELFSEFIRFRCQNNSEDICSFCSTGWVGTELNPCPQPYPNEDRLPSYHYKSYDETPVTTSEGLPRTPDDMQPRAQLKKMFKRREHILN